MSGPTLIVSKTADPGNNLKELVAWLKANHANVVQAHNGAGGSLHLCGVELQRITAQAGRSSLSWGRAGFAGHDRRAALT